MENVDRMALRLAQFGKALVAFKESIAEDTGDRKSRNSLLLSYVFTFEMAWKSLRLAMSEQGLEAPDWAAAVLRAAFQAGMITDADAWEKLRTYRNDVSHAYDEGKAVEIAAYVTAHAAPSFETLLAKLERHE